MRRITYPVSFAVLLICSIAVGGAWDVGPFENDDALDWVWELENSNDSSVIESSLRDVTRSMLYISAPECSRAIAAAEVVAALAGNPHADLPDAVVSWTTSNRVVPDEELVALAKQAVTLVRDSRKSELAKLWRESGSSNDGW